MEYSIESKNESGKVLLNVTENGDGITLLDISVSFDEPTMPQPVEIRWSEPSVDIFAQWSGRPDFDRTIGPNWKKRRTAAQLASAAPVMTWLSNEGKNRLTVTISDAATPTEIAGGLLEETACLSCIVTFFAKPVGAISNYHARVRLDRRDVRYEEALRSADNFWVENGYPYAHVPDGARDAVYSCWYSFHQSVDPDAIIAQCRMAKKLGMETVIVDDGWQTDNERRGYAYCGDWEVAPSKVPSMKAFADAVHALGMKFMIWYSVPFVGKFSRAHERFTGMTLGASGRNYETLDPRYPEVREYLTGIYAKAMREWGLDGVKLDFIDRFKTDDPTPDPRRDTESLEEGVDMLLSGISESLLAVNPEALIEFRQTYFGPAVRRFGNMFRVSDCPDDPLHNRAFGVDMRFMLGDVPVHSDMLMWHPDDTPEAVAYQMISVLPTVPQISVLLDKIPQKQYEVLDFWLGFWRQHRRTLLCGRLEADHPEVLYSQVRMTGEDESVVIAYTDPVVTLPRSGALYVCNATGKEIICLFAGENTRSCHITVRGCNGDVIRTDTRAIDAGESVAVTVPLCGMIEIN